MFTDNRGVAAKIKISLLNHGVMTAAYPAIPGIPRQAFEQSAARCIETKEPAIWRVPETPEGVDKCLFHMAEGVGFEPTDSRPSTVFKTVALNHSATLPVRTPGHGTHRPGPFPKDANHT